MTENYTTSVLAISVQPGIMCLTGLAQNTYYKIYEMNDKMNLAPRNGISGSWGFLIRQSYC